jgi:hypothetical protein
MTYLHHSNSLVQGHAIRFLLPVSKATSDFIGFPSESPDVAFGKTKE